LVQSSPPKPYLLVETQPLPEANIVKTIPLNSVSQINSGSKVSIIATATEPRLAREIDDADLLSLAAPNPVILVRLGPHSAELVFAHTTDADAPEHQTEPQ
jgi:predicted secreted protein